MQTRWIALLPMLLIAACVGSPRAPEADAELLPAFYPTLGVYSNVSAFPATVTEGHHFGSFVCWLPQKAATSSEPYELFLRYCDKPSDRSPGNVPYLIGALKGTAIRSVWAQNYFEIDHEFEASELRLEVNLIHIADESHGDMGSGFVYFKMPLSALPPRISKINMKFNHFAGTCEWTLDENTKAMKATEIRKVRAESDYVEDVSFDIARMMADEISPSPKLTDRRTVRNDYPESGVSWSWEVAKNWRGVELLDGLLVYKAGPPDPEQLWFMTTGDCQWTFSRGAIGGQVLTYDNWSYTDDADNWNYCLIKESGQQFGDKREGKWLGTYTDGGKAYEREYRNGELIADTSWYPDGRRLVESTFDGGAVTITYFNRNGSPRVETRMKGGIKQGRQRVWHDNGQLSQEKYYEKGSPAGAWHAWDEQGNLIYPKPE
jgi:hypothetical protein